MAIHDCDNAGRLRIWGMNTQTGKGTVKCSDCKRIHPVDFTPEELAMFKRRQDAPLGRYAQLIPPPSRGELNVVASPSWQGDKFLEGKG